MPVRIQLPSHCWPRSESDLKTIDQRLGGRTDFIFGPKIERTVRDLHGKVRRRSAPSFVRFCLEYEAEAPGFRPPANPPENQNARDFLKALARRSAKAWATAAMSSVGTEETT